MFLRPAGSSGSGKTYTTEQVFQAVVAALFEVVDGDCALTMQSEEIYMGKSRWAAQCIAAPWILCCRAAMSGPVHDHGHASTGHAAGAAACAPPDAYSEQQLSTCDHVHNRDLLEGSKTLTVQPKKEEGEVR